MFETVLLLLVILGVAFAVTTVVMRSYRWLLRLNKPKECEFALDTQCHICSRRVMCTTFDSAPNIDPIIACRDCLDICDTLVGKIMAAGDTVDLQAAFVESIARLDKLASSTEPNWLVNDHFYRPLNASQCSCVHCRDVEPMIQALNEHQRVH